MYHIIMPVYLKTSTKFSNNTSDTFLIYIDIRTVYWRIIINKVIPNFKKIIWWKFDDNQINWLLLDLNNDESLCFIDKL